MKKIVNDVVTTLKKFPEPGKKTGSFWNFMKAQLAEESTWEEKHIKVIEKEIDVHLTKLDKKDLIEMWKNTDKGWEKFEEDKKVDVKEMKEDLTDELLGQVMDRMDDSYSSRESYFTHQVEPNYTSNKKHGDEDFEEEAEPENIDDEELDIDDDEILDNEKFEDDEETGY
jgi:hypothetical protein